MFENTEYSAIFDQRGADYDLAMRRYPMARREEFVQLLALASPHPGQAVADMPAGGGYLDDYLPSSIDLTLIETSKVFYNLSRHRLRPKRILADRFNKLPCAAASFDSVLSLAGLHHNTDQAGFFYEARRVLKAGGLLCIADVYRDSAVAHFLDQFVGAHLPEGHAGLYLDEQIKGKLERAGFEITFMQRMPLHWNFSSLDGMVDFCRLLFGLRQLTDAELRVGIDRYLNICVTPQAVALEWELLYVGAKAI